MKRETLGPAEIAAKAVQAEHADTQKQPAPEMPENAIPLELPTANAVMDAAILAVNPPQAQSLRAVDAEVHQEIAVEQAMFWVFKARGKYFVEISLPDNAKSLYVTDDYATPKQALLRGLALYERLSR